MPPRPGRSGALWAGAALSGLAHAGLIALATLGPPWLRPHRERPVPAIDVALVTPAAFEAANAAPTPPAEAPATPKAPDRPALAPARPVPPADPAVAVPEPFPEPTLAPAFDPESPLGLGLGLRPVGPALPAHRPRARPGQAAAPPADAAQATAAFRSAVRTAVEKQAGATAAGVGGTVRLVLIVNREGRLLAARLVAGSGVGSLDRGAIEAARTALLPRMPDAMPNARATVEVELVFEPPPDGRGG
ncbi:MAG TPA: TonB family protein [Amaricoccus sp.]|nr:TonB family protein [Amaricoccus sp.]